MTKDSKADNGFFNILTTGVGYLNRVRLVHPKKGKKGEPFLACVIAALNGPKNDVEYRYYDFKVSGGKAKELILKYQDAANSGRKVLLEFRSGDPWTDEWEKDGKPRYTEKGRLLFIRWINLDGERVYLAPPREGYADNAPVPPESSSGIPAEEVPSGIELSADMATAA